MSVPRRRNAAKPADTFPHTVTIYNTHTGDNYREICHITVLRGVFLDASRAVNVRESGLEGADAVDLYIPFGVEAVDGETGEPKKYAGPAEFWRREDRTGLWTLDDEGNTFSTMKTPVVTQTFDEWSLSGGDEAQERITNLAVVEQDARKLANMDVLIAHFYLTNTGSVAAAFAGRYEAAKERDGKMQAVMDGLFNAPVCEAVFEGVSVCAFSEGLPVWMNLMFSVLDEILENVDETERKINPRIAKYTEKYNKYVAKYHR